MIDYTKEPFYDIRKLPCGGWNSSRISVQSHGKWLQFREPNSKEAINPTVPVDYTKRYKPPKSFKVNNNSDSKESEIDSSFSNYLASFLNQNRETKKDQKYITVPPIEFDPERVVVIVNNDIRDFEQKASKTGRPVKAHFKKDFTSQSKSNESFSKRPNSSFENVRNQKNADDYFSTGFHCVSNEVEIPKTSRIIQKRKGDNKMKKSIGAHNNSTRSKTHTSHALDRPSTALKPAKTYLGETQFENGLIIVGNRPKTALNY